MADFADKIEGKAHAPLIMMNFFQYLRRFRDRSRIVVFLLSVLFFGFYLWLLRPAILGQLGGTFKLRKVPQEYLVFKNFIAHQSEFFRVLWVPKRQRFGFWSKSHPGIDAEKFFVEDRCQEPFCSLKGEMPEEWGQNCSSRDRCYVRELAYFLNPETAGVFSRMGVKYVVVPYDSEDEIFLADRKYSSQQRKEVEEFLDTISWLKKVEVVDKIAVYEVAEGKGLFSIDQKKEPVNKYVYLGGSISLATFLLAAGVLIGPRFKKML